MFASRIRRFLLLAGAVLLPALAAQAGTPLQVGYLPVTGHAKFFVAQEQGFFKQEGLDVELVQFQNSADGLAALRAGKLDIGAFGTTAPLVHIAKGAEIEVIGGVMGQDASIVTSAANAATIRKLTDLKGKKVATVRLASGDAVLRGALNQAGIDWQKDLEIFELKNPPAVIEAIKSGQVDAGVVWGPHDLRAEEQGLKVVIRSEDLSPGHPCCRLTIAKASAETNPQLWQHFIRAILKAEKFAKEKEHRSETVAIIVKYLKLEPALVEKAYYSPHLDQSTDPNVQGVEQFWATMQKSGFVESDRKIRDFINTEFYYLALTSLIEEQPKERFWQQLLAVYNQRDRS